MNNISVFAQLSTIDCKGHIESKPTSGGKTLSYLSWAWAWQILKEKFPTATYTIYENKDGLNYHTDGNTCWVKTGVTVEGIEHIEYLPVMDFRNASIPLAKVTSYDVNKSIQRSLTKAVARHGLGLYIYAGEDIPDPHDEELRAMVSTWQEPKREQPKPQPQAAQPAPAPVTPAKKRIVVGGKAWHSAVEKHAKGEDMTEAMEERYSILDAEWDMFFEAVNNYKRENNIQ